MGSSALLLAPPRALPREPLEETSAHCGLAEVLLPETHGHCLFSLCFSCSAVMGWEQEHRGTIRGSWERACALLCGLQTCSSVPPCEKAAGSHDPARLGLGPALCPGLGREGWRGFCEGAGRQEDPPENLTGSGVPRPYVPAPFFFKRLPSLHPLLDVVTWIPAEGILDVTPNKKLP